MAFVAVPFGLGRNRQKQDAIGNVQLIGKCHISASFVTPEAGVLQSMTGTPAFFGLFQPKFLIKNYG